MTQVKYLGVEMTRDGIDARAFVARRKQQAIGKAHQLIKLGMHLGGLPIEAVAILYKVFVRPILEASMCILQPFKYLTEVLEKAQCEILCLILNVPTSSSGEILRSLLQTPSMTQRCRWLRTSFVRRYRSLSDTHILKLAFPGPKNWITVQLSQKIYPDHVTKEMAWQEEMLHVQSETLQATDGYLLIDVSKKPAWFLRGAIPLEVIRPILLWVLKSFYGSENQKCALCQEEFNQRHLASCSTWLRLGDGTPPRFVPEVLLSRGTAGNVEFFLHNIAYRIASAVIMAWPTQNFDILNDTEYIPSWPPGNELPEIQFVPITLSNAHL